MVQTAQRAAAVECRTRLHSAEPHGAHAAAGAERSAPPAPAAAMSHRHCSQERRGRPRHDGGRLHLRLASAASAQQQQHSAGEAAPGSRTLRRSTAPGRATWQRCRQRQRQHTLHPHAPCAARSLLTADAGLGCTCTPHRPAAGCSKRRRGASQRRSGGGAHAASRGLWRSLLRWLPLRASTTGPVAAASSAAGANAAAQASRECRSSRQPQVLIAGDGLCSPMAPPCSFASPALGDASQAPLLARRQEQSRVLLPTSVPLLLVRDGDGGAHSLRRPLLPPRLGLPASVSRVPAPPSSEASAERLRLPLVSASGAQRLREPPPRASHNVRAANTRCAASNTCRCCCIAAAAECPSIRQSCAALRRAAAACCAGARGRPLGTARHDGQPRGSVGAAADAAHTRTAPHRRMPRLCVKSASAGARRRDRK
jgi:hypothetical protein